MTEKNIHKLIPLNKTQAVIGGTILIGIFILCSLGAAINESVLKWVKDNSDLASWVQAIGSIFALFVAIFISFIERRNAEKNKFLEDKKNHVQNKKIVIASINRLGGAIAAALKRFTSEGSRSKWDIKMMRSLLSGECEISKNAPLQYLNSEEQKAYFVIYLLGIQLVEAMLEAESQEFVAENGEVLVADEGYTLLLNVIENTRVKFYESIDILKENHKNDNFYS